jgi:hypothetical protein
MITRKVAAAKTIIITRIIIIIEKEINKSI